MSILSQSNGSLQIITPGEGVPGGQRKEVIEMKGAKGKELLEFPLPEPKHQCKSQERNARHKHY